MMWPKMAGASLCHSEYVSYLPSLEGKKEGRKKERSRFSSSPKNSPVTKSTVSVASYPVSVPVRYTLFSRSQL